MPKLAESIEVDWTKKTITVDGAEFPWYTNESGPVITHTVDGLPTLEITILAHRVTVHPSPPAAALCCDEDTRGYD